MNVKGWFAFLAIAGANLVCAPAAYCQSFGILQASEPGVTSPVATINQPTIENMPVEGVTTEFAESIGSEDYFQATGCRCNKWFFRGGVGVVLFGESARIESPTGSVIAGASATASDNTTFLFDIGYQVSPQWSITLTAGVPPETTVTGTGPLAGQVIGTARYAPAVLAVQRHFQISRCSTLYVGGGVNYTIFYETEDGLVTDLHIDNAVEGVIQAGIERKLRKNLGVYADVKKIWLDATADGFVGGTPSIVRLKLNPTVLNFGLTYRF